MTDLIKRLRADMTRDEFYPLARDLCFEAADRIEALEVERDTLQEALLDTAAHLVGAASAYTRFAKRHHSHGKPDTDALYVTRVKDFAAAVSRARVALNPE